MAAILIVDDRYTNRELLVTLLRSPSNRLLQASDGGEALEMVRTEHPDLVIADILMPTMDGYEFVRRLRAEPAIARTKVIFCTAHYREQQAKNLAQACGVQRVLTKPCEPEVVMRTVMEVLDENSSAQAVTPPDEFEQAHLRLITDKLSQKAHQLRTSNQRLTVLTEIGLQLASERDRARLITALCDSARKLVGAKSAISGAGDFTDMPARHFALSGIDANTASRIDPPVLNQGIAGVVLHERHPRRLVLLPESSSNAGLPSHYPPVHSVLCTPVTSPMRPYGWVCVTDKLGAAEFSEEDERLLAMLAALAGRIYENGSLYAELRQRVDQLESEIGERKRVEAELRLLNAQLEQRAVERLVQIQTMVHELEALRKRRGPDKS